MAVTMNRHLILGLAFAAAASLAELAPIITLLRLDLPLAHVLAAGLAYQLGGALARWGPGRAWAWASGVLTAGAMLLVLPPGAPVWFGGLALGAWAFQAVRRRHAHVRPNDKPSTAAKRTARVAGFVAAALAPPLACLVAVAGIVLTASTLPLGTLSEPRPRLSGNRFEMAMIVHQSHYFTYCYGLLLILCQLAGGPNWVGVWFGLGWLTYLSAERLWRGAPLRRALVLGHAIVAITLLGLFVLGHHAWGAVLCWTLTGFGGGTVFGIAKLHRQSGGPEEALDLAEDLGHVGGAALALALVVSLGLDAWSLAAVGAALALLTIFVLQDIWRLEGREHLGAAR